MTTPSTAPPPPEEGTDPAAAEEATASPEAPPSRPEDGLAALGAIRLEEKSSGPPPDPFLDGEAEALLRRYLSLPPIRVSEAPPGEQKPASTVPVAPNLDRLKAYDRKLLELEPYLATGNWDKVLETLSAEEELPPQLALVLALAQRERDKGDAHPEQVAIAAMAALLGVPEDNEAAVLLAKRILRRNPVAWQQRRAPRAYVSVLIVLLIAVLGAAVGYLAGPAVPLFE